MNVSTMASAAVGMAVGAAVMGMATQDRRQMRKTVHKLAKGAEKTLVDLVTQKRLPARRPGVFFVGQGVTGYAPGWQVRCR